MASRRALQVFAYEIGTRTTVTCWSNRVGHSNKSSKKQSSNKLRKDIVDMLFSRIRQSDSVAKTESVSWEVSCKSCRNPNSILVTVSANGKLRSDGELCVRSCVDGFVEGLPVRNKSSVSLLLVFYTLPLAVCRKMLLPAKFKCRTMLRFVQS